MKKKKKKKNVIKKFLDKKKKDRKFILCMLGNFACFFVCGLSFFKINFFKKSVRNAIRVSNGLDPDQSVRNAIRVSNGLDPDQARQYVRHNLGPNCFQRLSADDKSCH